MGGERNWAKDAPETRGAAMVEELEGERQAAFLHAHCNPASVFFSSRVWCETRLAQRSSRADLSGPIGSPRLASHTRRATTSTTNRAGTDWRTRRKQTPH